MIPVSRTFISQIPHLALRVCLRGGQAVLPGSQFLPRANQKAPSPSVCSPVSAVSPRVPFSARPKMNGTCLDPQLVFTFKGLEKHVGDAQVQQQCPNQQETRNPVSGWSNVVSHSCTSLCWPDRLVGHYLGLPLPMYHS